MDAALALAGRTVSPFAGLVNRLRYGFPSRYLQGAGRIGDDLMCTVVLRELRKRLADLYEASKLVEAQRIWQRTQFDLEMMREVGYCSGIENYSRHIAGRPPGSRPACLLDYFPKDFLLVVDESHVTVPQIGAMWHGDRNRKMTLIEHGFRLPSALDNRPLTFEEWESMVNQVIFVSATPGAYELDKSRGVFVEQVIRPTGDEVLACVYYIHGGGMTNLSCFDGMYRGWGKLVAANGVAVVMVDFRNAVSPSSVPEVAPYPAGLDDCVAGFHWTVEHAAELGNEVPAEPLIFLKPPSALIAHHDRIVYPAASQRVDYEGELGVVIGRRAHHVKRSEAGAYIFGYTCVNDVTARDLQRKDEQWTRAKGFDTFCPVGPWIVPQEEVRFDELRVRTFVDDQKRQDEGDSNQVERPGAGARVCDRSARAAVFAAHRGEDRPHTRPHAAVEIARPEARGYLIGYDLLAPGVGQGAFQPVPGLDIKVVVLREDEQDGAVVAALAAGSPGLGHADSIVLDR